MSEHILVLPRLRVQNVNCISSPLTWGFPSISAFTGLMVALERRLGPDFGLHFQSVGVVCHNFEAQVTKGGYTRSFSLTRNPVLKDGGTAAIVEEGRAHVVISLVFTVKSTVAYLSDEEQQEKAEHVAQLVAGMRIAGGSVMPSLTTQGWYTLEPLMQSVEVEADKCASQFKRLRRQLLPGFALVSRDDVLQKRFSQMQQTHVNEEKSGNSPPTLLDAWLDLSRINYRASKNELGHVTWRADKRPGWLVPIPVGFVALSELHAAGTVTNARDMQTPFRFVECVYSIGQWMSPHRITDVHHFMWKPVYEEHSGLYRCVNEYPAPEDVEIDTEPDAEFATESETETLSQPNFD